jgi:hypothetical protein
MRYTTLSLERAKNIVVIEIYNEWSIQSPSLPGQCFDGVTM